jgi:hypothetical protein
VHAGGILHQHAQQHSGRRGWQLVQARIVIQAARVIVPWPGALADNGGPTLTHALPPDSPAVDAGVCGTLLTDQRGESRPGQGSTRCDAGAFEAQGVAPRSFPLYLPIIARAP